MLSYIIRRLLLMIPTLIGITAVVFFIMAMSPGGVGGSLLNQMGEMEPGQAKAVRDYYNKRYGLDQPAYIQYVRWLNQISPIGLKQAETDDGSYKLEGFGFKAPDLGYSFSKSRRVTELYSEALPITLLLNISTVPIIYIISIATGVYAARHRGKMLDIVSGVTLLGLWSVPTIWAGVMFIGIFANREYQKWFPAGGLQSTVSDQMHFLPTIGGFFSVVGFTVYVTLWGIAAVLAAFIVAIPAYVASQLWSTKRPMSIGIFILYTAAIATLVLPTFGSRITLAVVVALVAAGLGAMCIDWARFKTFGKPYLIVLVALPFVVGICMSGVLPQEMSPDRGWLIDRIWHLVLPIVCLVYGSFAFMSKIMRSALLDNLSADYVRTARAKGVDDTTVLWTHAFRNSLIPLITIAASFLPSLLAGSVIVETLFSIPGMGQLTIDAIYTRDRELVLAGALIGGLLSLISILIADLCYAVADPRVSYD